jgi:hypothetical protein
MCRKELARHLEIEVDLQAVLRPVAPGLVVDDDDAPVEEKQAVDRAAKDLTSTAKGKGDFAENLSGGWVEKLLELRPLHESAVELGSRLGRLLSLLRGSSSELADERLRSLGELIVDGERVFEHPVNDLADRGVDRIAGRGMGWTSDRLADELTHGDAAGLVIAERFESGPARRPFLVARVMGGLSKRANESNPVGALGGSPIERVFVGGLCFLKECIEIGGE